MAEGDSAAAAMPLTTDRFLGGRIALRQPRRGHRAGTDAVLLAAAVPAEAQGLVLDIGAGVGAAGLAVAALRPAVAIGLVERDPALALLAAENLDINEFASRGQVHAVDIFDAAACRSAGLAAGSAAIVITNPPFFDPSRSRPSPHAGKRAAHVMPAAGGQPLADWIARCRALLASDGLFVMIHRPEVMPVILAACEGLGELGLVPVYPQHGKPASRILVRGRKGSRAPVSLAPPIFLHEGDKFSAEAEAIHRGDMLINFGR